MYFLDGCPAGLAPVLGIVNVVINAIMIGVPILLIVLGMVDLGKAVIASKEDEVKKAEENVQKVTDKFVKEIDTIIAAKEKEVMSV